MKHLFRLAMVACVVVGPALARAAQPAAPPKNEALNALDGPTRAVVLKRAKHFLRFPSGLVVDVSNLNDLHAAWKANLRVNAPSGPFTSGRLSVQSGTDAMEWGIAGISGHNVTRGVLKKGIPPLAQMWMNAQELVSEVTAMGPGHIMFQEPSATSAKLPRYHYLLPHPTCLLAGQEPFGVESPTPEVRMLLVNVSGYSGEKKTWTPSALHSYACERNDLLFTPRGVKTRGAIVLLPVLESSGDRPAQKVVVVGGKELPLFRAVDATELTMSTEALATSVKVGEVKLTEWTCKSVRDGAIEWKSRQLGVKSANAP